MDNEGYLKISNFGMSKHLKKDEKAMSFCGSPEYIGNKNTNNAKLLAPEILLHEGHNNAADWWSFGILL